MGMLLIGEKFDFKYRTFPRGLHQNSKVLIPQNCHFVVTALFLWGQGATGDVYNGCDNVLTLKWSRGVPMDPKISFRANARKRKVIGRSPSLTLSNFTSRFFWWQKNLH